MKSKILFISFVLVFSTIIAAQGEICLVRIDPPGPQLVKKRSIAISAGDVQKILSGIDITNIKANIEFATIEDFVIARLGKIGKGEISWAHKIEKGKMTIKFGKSEYKGLLEKVRAGSGRPGYQIILSDKKSNAVINSFEITFKPFPNLSVELSYPVNTAPGEVIGDKVIITIKNTGSAPSEEVVLDMILSKNFQIPLKKYSVEEGQEGVRLLEHGTLKVKGIDPGGEIELKPDIKLRLPETLETGRYYLGAVIDPEQELIESVEDDNVFRGFLMVAPKEPKRITMLLAGSTLYYTPKTFDLKIRNAGLDISSSKEWRKCQIRPYIFHLKHATWKDFFWEVNTDEKMVWKITGTKFCKKGGKAVDLKAKVIPEGGSTTVPPKRFRIIFGVTKIIFEPKTKKFDLILGSSGVAYLPFWQTCKTTPLKYHFKYVTWDKNVWEVDPLKKTLNKIPIEKFCKKCQEGEELPVKMELTE